MKEVGNLIFEKWCLFFFFKHHLSSDYASLLAKIVMLRHNHAFLCGRIKKIFCFQLCPSSYYLWRYQVATELHVCTNMPIFIETFGKVKCDAYYFKNWALNVMLSKHHNWVWSMLCLQASQLAKEMLCLESITIGYDQCCAYRHHNWLRKCCA